MTIGEFVSKHIRYNSINDKPEVYDIAILNAAPGRECMYMCGLFGVPMSSAMIKGGPDEEYVSFVADSDACSSYWVGSDYEPKKVKKVIYYPEIEDIIDDIFGKIPEFRDQMPGAIKEVFNSNELYKSLGMGILVEES